MKTIWSLQWVQRVVERCQRIRKHIANAFQNNNSALESVSNGGWKTFNAFLTYLLCRVFANRVTYRLTHPTETAIRRLLGKSWSLTYYMASFKKSLRENWGANVLKLIFAIESFESICKKNNKTVSSIQDVYTRKEFTIRRWWRTTVGGL